MARAQERAYERLRDWVGDGRDVEVGTDVGVVLDSTVAEVGHRSNIGALCGGRTMDRTKIREGGSERRGVMCAMRSV